MNATGESDLKNYYDYVDTLRESKLRPVLDKLLPVLARSAGVALDDPDVSFPPLWTPTAKETAEIAQTKSGSIVSAFQSGLLDVPTAMQELRGLSDETGLFGSITDEAIAANTGKTYQDVTALRDPLAGLTGGTEGPFDSSAVEPTPTADYSPSQPRDDHGRWTNGGSSGKLSTNENESGKIDSSEQEESTRFEPDIPVPRSVGAKAKSVYIKMPDGSLAELTPGTRITKVQTIAGHGRNRQIDIVDLLVDKYPGTSPEKWEKQKGMGYIDFEGESHLAELHWYYEPTVGRVEWKLKHDAGGNWFYDEDW